MNEAQDGQTSTKEDIAKLDTKIDMVAQKLDSKIDYVAQELRGKITLLHWMLGFDLALWLVVSRQG